MIAAAALALAAWGLASGEAPVSRSPAAPTTSPPVLSVRPIGAVHVAPASRARVAEVSDELIIAPRGSADAAALAIADAGGEVAWRAPSTGLLLARFANADDARQARAMLAADPRVSRIYANHIMTGAGIATSPGILQKWLLQSMLMSPSSHPANGIVVAVLDTGAAYETYGPYAVAPDLAATPFAAGWDFVNNDGHPNDDNGHGTHITNIIAASATITPMARNATIMPVKVLDASNQGTELALAEGIRYAVDHGAHVINMSLSFPPGYFPSRFLQDAVDYANAQGVVMVAAAGNQGGDQVTFPAAFRDVIAVGASRLSPIYRSPKALPWFLADLFLTRAAYSNGGNKVEVAAPAGAMDGDANGDGLPEAAIAQTFLPGSTTQFQYRLWAGTSQAAAQVSGIAASMLGANHALTPEQVRSILGESARPELGFLTLAPTVGRGYLRGDLTATNAGRESSDTRPHYGAAIRLGIATSPGSSVAVGSATVEILDDGGHSVAGVYVYGSFSGAVAASGLQRTDGSGVAHFVSPPLATPHVVAFEVDAVADSFVAPHVFDRPRGAIRIDTCSLELLSTWAFGQGIATSPGINAQGIATSPGNTVSGSGIATSPGSGANGDEDPDGIATSPGTSGQGIATSPGSTVGGLGVAVDPIALHVPLAAGEVDFVNLLNYSWTGSTMPMAVAVDTAWFRSNFPNAPIVTSSGAGIATSPITFDATTSFGAAVSPPSDADGCTPTIVRTFVPNEIADGVAPVAPDPAVCVNDATCTAQRGALADIWAWAATGQGIATSPGYTVQTQLTPHAFDEAVRALWAWSQFAMQEPASPVSEYGGVLDAAGIATSPGVQASGLDDPDGIATSPGVGVTDDDGTVSDDGSGGTPTADDQALIDWLTANSADAAATAQ